MAYEQTIDQIISFVAPIIIFIGVGWIVYRAFSKPLSGLGGFLGNLKDKLFAVKDERITVKSINYE